MSKNIDQQKKAENGDKHEKYVIKKLKETERWKSNCWRAVLSKEKSAIYEKKVYNDFGEGFALTIKMDHEYLLINLKKKIILVVHIDSTTSYRHDRLRGKANEAEDLARIEDQIIRTLKDKYKDLADYQVIRIVAVIFPDKDNLSCDPENKRKENDDIDKFCIAVSKKVSDLSSNKSMNAKKIDTAMRISDLQQCVKMLMSDNNIDLNENTLNTLWSQLKQNKLAA